MRCWLVRAGWRSRLTIEPMMSATTGRKRIEKIDSSHEMATIMTMYPTMRNGSRNETCSVLVMQNCTTPMSEVIFEMMSPLRCSLK